MGTIHQLIRVLHETHVGLGPILLGNRDGMEGLSNAVPCLIWVPLIEHGY